MGRPQWKNILSGKALPLLVLIGLYLPSHAHAVYKQKISLSVIERASRVTLGTQEILVPYSGAINTFTLSLGSALKDMQLTVTARPVKINSLPGYNWLEAELTGPAAKHLAYLVTTTKGTTFTAGVGFKAPSDPSSDLVLMFNAE
jgi:hypothetical protein